MITLTLKPGREKSVVNRHPWVFSGALLRRGQEPEAGSIVAVQSAEGQFLGRGYANAQSQIAVRLLTWDEDEQIDASFWERRLLAAISRREALLSDEVTNACRLVFAESDGLPGLIVDRYADWLVLQSLTLGIERHKPLIAEILADLLHPAGIYERSDADVRRHEGLASVAGPLLAEAPAGLITMHEHGQRYEIDLIQGHKTGFYLDQRENRHSVAAYAKGREMLNVFAYTGGFGVAAAAQGAKSVLNLDSSRDALTQAQRHMALNDLAATPTEYVEGDAFKVLRQFRQEERQFDLVVLDPPKFAFSKGQLNAATRGYKDINMLGMQLLRPGGLLVTFSCSGLVNEDLFQKVLFGASVDVGREVRIIERLSQGLDHPVLLTFPEGAYLKGFICHLD